MALDLRYGRYDDLTGSEDISYNEISDNVILANYSENEVGIETGVIGLEDDSNKIAATIGMVHDNLIRGNAVDGANYGVYFYVTSDLLVQGNELTDCNEAVHIESEHSHSRVNFNAIYGSDSVGIKNTTATVVDATYNWWGNASGPQDPCGVSETDGMTCYSVDVVKNTDGMGDAVTENVRYCPWLAVPIISSNGPCPVGDLDGDCDVDFDDFARMAANWLVGTGP